MIIVSVLLIIGYGGAIFITPCERDKTPFPTKSGHVECVSNSIAYRRAMKYLEKNLPSFDEENKCSLGFSCSSFSDSDPVDGLNVGIANYGANISLSVRNIYPWAASVPEDIFLEYVLPYGNVNEARTNWRPLLLSAVQDVLKQAGKEIESLATTDVVDIVNNGVWTAFGGETIVFKSSQTPLIYDPMSILAFRYASCTGVSIFFVDALRAIGIPSRIAGTPAWNTVPENGNHNWIEVWTEQEGWRFIESAPAGGGETLANPCDKWFCNPTKFSNGTQVFAARFDQSSKVRYPMAWDIQNTQIPGEDRTVYYQSACMAC